jgi:short-subunit dehydrogenase
MKRAILTGASSGIGASLARELSRRGWAVALLARRLDLLRDVAKDLRESTSIECDVANNEAVKDAVKQSEQTLGGPFDLAIANAGIGVVSHATKFDVTDAELMVRVNLLGMIYLFGAVVPGMAERGAGRFVGVASLAGLRGLPTNSVYSATKSAMQTFLEASRVELVPRGVGITIVNPGFVATPMTEKNRFRMPFLMTADAAAVIIADGIERGKRVVEFPFGTSLMMRTARLIPDALYDRVMTPYAKRKIDPSKVKR